METLGLLIDFTECIGCQECEVACQQQNKLPPDPLETDLSYRNYTVVLQHEASGQHHRKLCMHCITPSCVSACPVGALTKTARGPVLYDAGKCMGCRYCMVACPFGVPRYEWDSPAPVVAKCTFCNDRVAGGGQTACSWVCPTGATRMGTRKALLETARDRIRRKPGRYVNHIYGETEVGGTSVLMLSGVPFKELGFPTGLGTEPLPELTLQVLRKIPPVVIIGGLLLGGVSWIINRRIELEALKDDPETPGPEPGDERETGR
ncbi:MAG: 4Fe-4S dicluster domain-containing protein [Gemmatimonadota bacterium]|nr:4Fe-4S dicluster domain-containing protein [Gemmatimonadota bacterium]